MNSRILQQKSDQADAHNSQNLQSRLQAAPPEPTDRNKKPISRFERWLICRLLQALGNPEITVVFWSGEEFHTTGRPSQLRVILQDRGALWRLLFDPEFQFGELYSSGRLEIVGDCVELMILFDHCLAESKQGGLFYRSLNHWLHRPCRNALSSSKSNIHHHYDIGNDFYKLWLDKQLLYTCAYFPSRDCSLEDAQIAKMDHVCRKLQLRPGQRVIEAGCGWGALSLHMAKQYGVTVRAYNISHEQIVYARDRARSENLDHRVEFIEDDWRNITGRCDVFVSVGMLEHVGKKNYRRLGDVIGRCLDQNGFGLIHTIGQNQLHLYNTWTERRIFPGAYPPTLREMMEIFESGDFSILDVENLRLHYAETTRHWLERYDESIEIVREMFDERLVRMWRLYLAASVACFLSGNLQLYQVVFAHGKNNHPPRTREHLYGSVRLPSEESSRMISDDLCRDEGDHSQSFRCEFHPQKSDTFGTENANP